MSVAFLESQYPAEMSEFRQTASKAKYEYAVEHNLDRAHAIGDFRFPTVDIRKTAASQQEEATEEDVADIFVRINNQGTRLGQADFVLSLLSVFHGDLRDVREVDGARLRLPHPREHDPFRSRPDAPERSPAQAAWQTPTQAQLAEIVRALR